MTENLQYVSALGEDGKICLSSSSPLYKYTHTFTLFHHILCDQREVRCQGWIQPHRKKWICSKDILFRHGFLITKRIRWKKVLIKILGHRAKRNKLEKEVAKLNVNVVWLSFSLGQWYLKGLHPISVYFLSSLSSAKGSSFDSYTSFSSPLSDKLPTSLWNMTHKAWCHYKPIAMVDLWIQLPPCL